jgi:hypothetical protein
MSMDDTTGKQVPGQHGKVTVVPCWLGKVAVVLNRRWTA